MSICRKLWPTEQLKKVKFLDLTLLIENHCDRLYQRLAHHQTPKLERVYAMGPCMICSIENLWKVAPISTSTAPIATCHCAFMDMSVSTK